MVEYKTFEDYRQELLDNLSTESSDLTMVGSAFVTGSFIHDEALNNILQQVPKTATKQAYKLMNAVRSQIKVRKGPEKSSMFVKFWKMMRCKPHQWQKNSKQWEVSGKILLCAYKSNLMYMHVYWKWGCMCVY